MLTPLITALDKCKQYAIQQVAYKSKASWVQYVREQLSLGGSKLFNHIASEEKSFLNVSLTDYPQYDNSPQAFLKDQAADWSKYWSSETQEASTKAAFKHLRYQARAHSDPIKIQHDEFVKKAKAYRKTSRGSIVFWHTI